MSEESSEQEDGGGEAEMRQQWATENLERRAEVRQRKAKGESPAEGLKSAEQQIRKIQKILRIINGASAATLAGLIITFIIMNLQLILKQKYNFMLRLSVFIFNFVTINSSKNDRGNKYSQKF